MNVNIFIGGFDKNLCYLIWCKESKEAILIDASVEINSITNFINSNELNLKRIIITHSHHDHIHFLYDWKLIFPLIKVCAFKNTNNNYGNNFQKLNHHETITIGQELLTILFTPGHFYDSICIWNIKSKMLFTGDTIFVGRTGRVKSTLSSIDDLYNSIYNIILKLPSETIIYPGHHYGYTKTISIRENISLSPFFQCKNIIEFKKVMEKFEKNRR